MVIAPKETVEETNNAFSSEHRAAVLELFQRITGGRNVLFALIYH